MKKPTNSIVHIPQLRKKRTIYTEDNKKYILMNGVWWEINDYKKFLKDTYSINISYEYY